MPLQPTVTCPVAREYAPQGPRQRLNAGRWAAPSNASAPSRQQPGTPTVRELILSATIRRFPSPSRRPSHVSVVTRIAGAPSALAYHALPFGQPWLSLDMRGCRPALTGARPERGTSQRVLLCPARAATHSSPFQSISATGAAYRQRTAASNRSSKRQKAQDLGAQGRSTTTSTRAKGTDGHQAPPRVPPNMPLQPTGTRPRVGEYAQRGPRQRLNAGR
jgi:hypothetical protein